MRWLNREIVEIIIMRYLRRFIPWHDKDNGLRICGECAMWYLIDEYNLKLPDAKLIVRDAVKHWIW